MKKVIVFLLVAVIALSMVACGSGTSDSSKATTSTAQESEKNLKDQLYIEVSALGNLDYFYDHKLGMQKVGEDLGVKTEYVGPAEYDMNAMVASFDQAIAKKPNGIVVVGFESSLNPQIKKAQDAGIPVITVDADLPDSGRLTFVGTGNVNAGMMGGDKLAELIGKKGKVAIMTKPGQSNLEERVAGYQAALKKYPDIQIVQIVDTKSDPVVAAQAAATLLQKYPDLAGIACVEAAGGSGASTAVKEAKLQGKVKIIAMDRGNDVIQAIEDGVISASVAQQTALMPYYAVQVLYNLANSKIDITSDNKAAGVKGIPAAIDTGVIIVDINNAKYFMRDGK
jgi:ribose transport system substrate-binding protein